MTDLKSLIAGEEAVYVDTEKYWDCNAGGCETYIPKFKPSQGVRVDAGTIDVPIDDGNFFAMSCHRLGKKYYLWASTDYNFGAISLPAGQIVEVDVDDLAGCSMGGVINP